MYAPTDQLLPEPSANEANLIHVLHVDDEVALLDVSKQILEMQGPFQVETALSVSEAKQKIAEKQFDAVISDYEMPEKTGLDFLKELRDSGNTIPFILFTGKGREDVSIMALNLGADYYINKIGDPETVFTEMAHSINQVVEKSKAKKELHNTKEKFETYVNLASVILLAIDTEKKVNYINEKGCKILQYTKKEIIGKNWFDNFLPKELIKETKAYNERLISGRIKPVEYHENYVLTKNGETRLIAWHNILLKDEKGRVTGTLSSGEDITEKKKAEKILRNSEKRFRNSLDTMMEGCQIISKDWLYLYVNDAAAKHGRLPKEKLLGKKIMELYPDIEKTKMFSVLNRCMKKRVPNHFENEFVYPDGERGWFELSVQPVPEGIFILSIDITERKKIEAALRSSEEKYRGIINAMNDTAWVIGLDGKFIDVNKAAVEALGYTREELLTMGPKNLSKDMPEEAINDLIDRMPSDKIQVFEATHFTKSGEQIPVEISSSLVTYQGKQAILSIARDITERKKAARALDKMMKELLLINEKLEVIGRLTRHDVRNKLSIITNYVFLAKKRCIKDSSVVEYLDSINSTIDQVEKIFEFNKNYEMLGVEDLYYVYVKQSFAEALMLFSGTKNVKVVNECQGLMLLADSLLTQLFYNLIDNSLKHGKNVSEIKAYYKQGKNKVKLIFEDNGGGIPEEEKQLVFKDGYGKSTGYGLYLINKLCAVYGWSIKETGKPNKGAKFVISIPTGIRNEKPSYKIE